MRRNLLAIIVLSCCATYVGCGNPAPSNPAPAVGVVAPIATPGIAPPIATPSSAAPAGTGTPATRAATVAPYLDDQTVAIVRVDVAALAIDQSIAELMKDPASPLLAQQQQFQQGVERAKEFQKQVQEIYIVVSLSDVPVYAPFGVLKLHAGADPKQIFAMYKHGDLQGAVDQKEFDDSCLVKNDVLIIGNSRAIYRFKNGATPAVVPNLEQAFQLAGNGQVQAIFAPTDGARTQLATLMPEFPPPLGIDGPTLLNSIKFAAVSVQAPPGFELKIEAQGRDAASAQQVHGAIAKIFELAKQSPNMIPELREFIDLMLPQLSTDKLTFSLQEGNPLFKKFEKYAATAALQARLAAQQMQSANNLKQLALAMHGHHESQRKLPAATNGAGLSWRVHLLPYIDEQELYAQFKLDEAWDSPTNKPLVEKMPKVFEHPTAKPAAPGLTVYVVPTGDTTVFPGQKSIAMAEVSDGTALTMLLLEVNAENAVIWSKPDDWAFSPSSPINGLGGLWTDGSTTIALVDGSVLTIIAANDSEQFGRLVARADGQPVDLIRLRAPTSAGLSLPFAIGAPPQTTPTPQTPQENYLPLANDPGRDPMPMPGVPMPGVNPANPVDAAAAAVDPPYIVEAKKAFAAGQDNEAFAYLYAEALAGDDKTNIKNSLRWAAGVKRPVLALRWGIGLQYNSPRNYGGGPVPIGRGGSSPPMNNGNGGDPNAPKPGATPTTFIDYYTAELGTKLVEGLKTRVDQTQFGEVLKLYATGIDPAAALQADPAGAAAKALSGKPIAIVPGVMFVGMDKGGAAGQKELLRRAKEEQLDALVIYEVAVTPTRLVVNNSTKLMLFDVAKGEALHTSRILKNTVVEAARKENRGVDQVEDVLEKFFVAIDTHFTLEDLPEVLTETNVTARVQKLTETPPENKLTTLLEIAFWLERSLISPENAKIAYEKILGPDGAKLIDAPTAERKGVIEKLLPKSGGAGTSGKRLGLGL